MLVVALAGCAAAVGGGSGGGQTGSPSDITGRWQLVSGTDAKGPITPGSAVVTFTVNGASSGGRGPCNSFGATTRGATTGTIAIVVGIHTEIACVDPDLMTTETRYFAALDKVTTATLADGTLTLSGNGDTLVFSEATK